MTAPVPTWNFWHPVPLWQVIAVAAVLQLVFVVPLAALEGGLHLGIPEWVGSALGGGLLFPIIRAMARRRSGGASTGS
jgi:hypothetical protein